MAAPRGGTRERILDAAEKLFALKGYDGTSTRAIVAASGDTIGSLSYHFGSKEKLLREVVRRRFDAIADARRARYREAVARAGDRGASLEDVVDAIVVPYVERALRGGRGWRAYTQLIAGLLTLQKVYQKRILAGLGEETAREFIGWLTAVLPQADPGDIAYAYEFMIGCIIEACVELAVDRVGAFTAGAWSSKDFDFVAPRLVCFITAGVAAIVAADLGRKQRPRAKTSA